jgi:phosphoglycolate phosphatase
VRAGGDPLTVVAFDLDGTLVDTGADIAAAVNRVRADYGLDPLPQDEIVGLTGLGAETLIERAVGRDVPAATRRYVDYYAERPAEHAQPYDGVSETLRRLHDRGVAMAVCTNKRGALARAVLSATGLDRYLGAVVAADDVARTKPDPEHLLAALRAIGGEPATALYVGDNEVDVATAQAAGVRCAIVAWGRAADGAPRLQRFADLLA